MGRVGPGPEGLLCRALEPQRRSVVGVTGSCAGRAGGLYMLDCLHGGWAISMDEWMSKWVDRDGRWRERERVGRWVHGWLVDG